MMQDPQSGWNWATQPVHNPRHEHTTVWLLTNSPLGAVATLETSTPTLKALVMFDALTALVSHVQYAYTQHDVSEMYTDNI